jgi:hypothetical protein
METLVSCLYTDFCNHECEGGVMGKAQPLSLLRETDFAQQFGVTGIGAQGIELEVGPEAGQQLVVFLVCGFEPFSRSLGHWRSLACRIQSAAVLEDQTQC